MPADVIHDPLIELLAIKLYEHDCRQTGDEARSWFKLDHKTREVYRQIAQGVEPIDDEGRLPAGFNLRRREQR